MPSAAEVKADDIMTPREKIKTVGRDTALTKVVGVLTEEGLHSVVVLDKAEYEGIFGHQELVKLQNIPPAGAKVGHFASRPTKVSSRVSLIELAEIMFKANARLVPVFEKDSLAGIVSERDLLNAALALEELKNKTVAELMSPEPFCVKEKDKVATALGIMRDFRISRLPVLDKDGRVVGVFESPAVLRRIVAKVTPESRLAHYGYTTGPGVTEELPIYRVQVRELMNSKPVLAKKEDGLVEKIAEAKKLGIETIIVVNENQEPAGVIAPRDIVEWLASLKKPSGIYMQISGWDPSLVGDFAEAQLHRLIEESVKKFAEIVKIREFAVHFKTYHETFDRVRFSLRARLYTDYGLFVAARHGYDIIAVANELFDDLERQVIQHERRHRDLARGRGRRTKFSKKGDQYFY